MLTMRHATYKAGYLFLEIPETQVESLNGQLKEFSGHIVQIIPLEPEIVSLEIRFPGIHRCEEFLDRYGDFYRTRFTKENGNEIS